MSALGTVVALGVVGAVIGAASSGSKKTDSTNGSGITAQQALAIQPLRNRAVELFKSAVNVDPTFPGDADAMGETNFAIKVIQTSTQEAELRELRDGVTARATKVAAAGMPTTAKNYTDAAAAINDVAVAVEAAKFASAKDLKVAGSRAHHACPHTPLARRGVQLHTSRGLR